MKKTSNINIEQKSLSQQLLSQQLSKTGDNKSLQSLTLHSVTKRIWKFNKIDNERVENILAKFADKYNLDNDSAFLLALRNFDEQECHRFLEPKLRYEMPCEPDLLAGVTNSALLLLKAVEENKKIAIYSDYDVDGVCSCALVYLYLKSIGAENLETYIPDRILEGYGLNKNAIDFLARKKVKILVVLDCGTNQNDMVQHAQKLGIKVVIIDHHRIDENIDIQTFVNPQQKHDISKLQYLCTAGLVFIVLAAIDRLRRQKGDLKINDLKEQLDLVALATIADVAPLIGLNRAYVSAGLRLLRKNYQQNLPINILARRAGCNLKYANATDLAFAICPLLNAPGRIASAKISLDFLLEKKIENINQQAERIILINKKRRKMQNKMIYEAFESFEEKSPVAVIGSENFHPGVVGIVASQIVHVKKCPAFVIAWNKIGIGSARANKQSNVGDIIEKAKHEKLILNGGGHKMAAGFKIEKHNYQKFKEFVLQKITEKIDGNSQEILNALLHIDIVKEIDEINFALYNAIAVLEPYGEQNPTPIIATRNVRCINARIVGENHITCQLQGDNNAKIKAIAFNAKHNNIGNTILCANTEKFWVAGNLRKVIYNNNTYLSIQILDIAKN